MTLKEFLGNLINEHSSSANEFPKRTIEDLVGFHLGLSWSEIQLKRDLLLSPVQQSAIRHNLQKIASGYPLSYVTREKEFYKYKFFVDERVLIPRPETELLVEEALLRLPKHEICHIFDFGTGSGCIGLSIARDRPLLRATLIDASKGAVEVCVKNAEALGLTNVTCRQLSLNENSFKELSQFPMADVIVANPPYIAEGDERVEKSVHNHEPHQALYAQDNGLSCIQTWLQLAYEMLKPEGFYLFEFGKDQENEIELLIDKNQWVQKEILFDYAKTPRFYLLKKAPTTGLN